MRKYIIYAFVMCTVTTACVQNKTEQTKQVTESNLETEEDNALIVGNVVLLGEDAFKLVLGDGSALGMDNLNGLRAHSPNKQITI